MGCKCKLFKSTETSVDKVLPVVCVCVCVCWWGSAVHVKLNPLSGLHCFTGELTQRTASWTWCVDKNNKCQQTSFSVYKETKEASETTVSHRVFKGIVHPKTALLQPLLCNFCKTGCQVIARWKHFGPQVQFIFFRTSGAVWGHVTVSFLILWRKLLRAHCVISYLENFTCVVSAVLTVIRRWQHFPF